MMQKKMQYLAFGFISALFFLGNIKFFKMVLDLLGLDTYSTFIAVGIFAFLDLVLGIYFLEEVYRTKKWESLVIFFIINVIFVTPYLIHGEWYRLIQYIVFMIPFSMGAILLCIEKEGVIIFWEILKKFSNVAFLLALLYIMLLFLMPPGENGIWEIEEFSYGDIAYGLLPFLFVESNTILSSYNQEVKKFLFCLIKFLGYFAAIIYSGTRSAILCMIFIIVILILRYLKNIIKNKKKYILSFAFSIVLIIAFCYYITPDSSRLNIVKGDMTYELQGNNWNDIFENVQNEEESQELEESNITQEESIENVENIDDEKKNETNTIQNDSVSEVEMPEQVDLLYNVSTKEYTSIDKIFEYYIVQNNVNITRTESMLYEDINNETHKYVIVNPSYKSEALNYHYPINSRVCLWATAWNEFLKSPFVGNGCLSYQIKYEYTFPHNIILEALADYGIVGTVLMVTIIIYILIYNFYYNWKKKQYLHQDIIFFILMYIPMYLLFTSLYYNGILIFSLTFLCAFVFYSRKRAEGKA